MELIQKNISWKNLLREAQKSIKEIDEAETIIKKLVEEVSNKKYSRLLIEDDKPSLKQIKDFENYINKIQKGEPLQYVLGYVYFMGMKLKVNPSVLIPRPETEELIELTKKYMPHSSPSFAIDFCSGSGCIALGLKKLYPDAEVWATDISEDALEVAKINAFNIFNSQTSIHFLIHDLLKKEPLKGAPEFDLILSNPPYISKSEASSMSKNVLDYEPHIALFVENNNPIIFYEALLEMAQKHLASNGIMLCEINPLFAKDLKELGIRAGFKSVIIKDMIGKNRFWKITK